MLDFRGWLSYVKAMCGSYALDEKKYPRLWEPLDGVRIVSREPFENYRVLPTHRVPGVRTTESGAVEETLFHWTFIPGWSKEKRLKFSTINCRSEEADKKPLWKTALRKRRCILAATGFYEPKKSDRTRKAEGYYYFTSVTEEPLWIAGIWELWQGRDETLETCAILTTTPNPVVAPIHARMPCLLRRDELAVWLDSGTDMSFAKKLLEPGERIRLKSWRVRDDLYRAKTAGPELIRLHSGIPQSD